MAQLIAHWTFRLSVEQDYKQSLLRFPLKEHMHLLSEHGLLHKRNANGSARVAVGFRNTVPA